MNISYFIFHFIFLGHWFILYYQQYYIWRGVCNKFTWHKPAYRINFDWLLDSPTTFIPLVWQDSYWFSIFLVLLSKTWLANWNTLTMWKVSNGDFFLVCIFLYSDWIRRFTEIFPVFSPNTGKYGPEKTPYLDTFHAGVNGQSDCLYFLRVSYKWATKICYYFKWIGTIFFMISFFLYKDDIFMKDDKLSSYDKLLLKYGSIAIHYRKI